MIKYLSTFLFVLFISNRKFFFPIKLRNKQIEYFVEYEQNKKEKAYGAQLSLRMYSENAANVLTSLMKYAKQQYIEGKGEKFIYEPIISSYKIKNLTKKQENTFITGSIKQRLSDYKLSAKSHKNRLVFLIK